MNTDAMFKSNNAFKPNEAFKPNDMFKNTMATIKQKTEEVSQDITQVAKKTLDFYTSKTVVIAGLALVIILCVFVAYGLYYFISYSIFDHSKVIIAETKIPVLCNTSNKFSITAFNKTGNGKRRSYTFWIYINDMTRYKGGYKHVFHIGDQDDLRRSSPVVFLDKDENKMYIRFGSNSEDSFSRNITSLQNLTDHELSEFMQQGIELPYIPIQRWVHIAVVVNENSNGGTIVGYVDGDIAKIVTTNEISGNGHTFKIYNLNLDKMGELYVGGSIESINGPGFSGLISKVTMFNYDLNDKDVYDNYNDGPLDGFLSALGLANYGLRSPIYKIV